MRLIVALLMSTALLAPALASAEDARKMPDYRGYMQSCAVDNAQAAEENGFDLNDRSVQEVIGAQCQCEVEHLPPAGTTVPDNGYIQAMDACEAEHDADPAAYDTKYLEHLRKGPNSLR